MFEATFQPINEYFFTESVFPDEMDFLLSEGWRNFGQYFFRHNVDYFGESIKYVIPLRIRLSHFKFSKSQRKIIRRNDDLKTIIRPALIDDEKNALFERHKTRFSANIPPNIYTFLDVDAASVPCQVLEFCVYEKDKLLAVSFLNYGNNSTSGIYAMFEPNETKRGLGIYTMLLEIAFSIQQGKSFYYQGYAHTSESFYDYKKRFNALEKYDWKGNWVNFLEQI
jgi:leucyl-tRNA---protein transferase